MKLYIAGGTCEHGRNCFALIENNEWILLDCGMGSGTDLYPLLEDMQIEHIKYLFLSHCHKDHIGSYSWLKKKGFHGTVICTSFTWQVLGGINEPHILIDQTPDRQSIAVDGALAVKWGRSGHCIGSVWYFIHWHGKEIFYSGDYCETSFGYPCDPFRDQYADLAILDCAYGNKPYDEIYTGFEFVDLIKYLHKNYAWLLLPVPLQGRGYELCGLLQNLMKKIPIYASQKLIDEWIDENSKDEWTFHNLRINEVHSLDVEELKRGVIFIDDAQLKKKESFALLLKVLERKGCVLLTGHIEEGAPADLIQSEEYVQTILYPVHLNIFSSHLLYSQNDFDQVILFHCKNKINDTEKGKWFSEPLPGSSIQF